MSQKRYIAKARPLIPLPLVLALGVVGVAIATLRQAPILSNGLPEITITIKVNDSKNYSKLPGN